MRSMGLEITKRDKYFSRDSPALKPGKENAYYTFL